MGNHMRTLAIVQEKRAEDTHSFESDKFRYKEFLHSAIIDCIAEWKYICIVAICFL